MASRRGRSPSPTNWVLRRYPAFSPSNTLNSFCYPACPPHTGATPGFCITKICASLPAFVRFLSIWQCLKKSGPTPGIPASATKVALRDPAKLARGAPHGRPVARVLKTVKGKRWCTFSQRPYSSFFLSEASIRAAVMAGRSPRPFDILYKAGLMSQPEFLAARPTGEIS